MSGTFRVASFNVENLFRRARVFDFEDPAVGDAVMADIEEFRKLMEKETYSQADKDRMFQLYDAGGTRPLKNYMLVREDRGKFWKYKSYGRIVAGVKAEGHHRSWDGTIEYLTENLAGAARANTARVIADVKPDVACIVEAESRPTLQAFNTELFKPGKRFSYTMLIDGNDDRGIDVGLYSNFSLGALRTHIYDRDNVGTIFSRDCLAVEVLVSGGPSLYVLCNHLKSRGYSGQAEGDAKRMRQATQLAKILHDTFDLTTDRVIVAGDFNDSPASAALQPLLSLPNLHDVLEIKFGNNPGKRWTYHYDSFDQIDYLLVSEPLRASFVDAGVNRCGIYDLLNLTTSAHGAVDVEKEYATVTDPTNAASDHGAVWAEFRLS